MGSQQYYCKLSGRGISSQTFKFDAKSMDHARKKAIKMLEGDPRYDRIDISSWRTRGSIHISEKGTPIYTVGKRTYTISRSTGKMSYHIMCE